MGRLTAFWHEHRARSLDKVKENAAHAGWTNTELLAASLAEKERQQGRYDRATRS